ncbi:MAG: 50S ribosomal protein L13 [Candidatus Peregrinibacteria bacterium GW2011_GWA2_47_7]|nr:MAG: 50S ribosomal protein L13 [Candidatus Peregrinibacteria bacterium GW2011_GWA2_47_7]
MKIKDSQKTYVPTNADLQRKWFIVDVKGKTLGQISTKIANILRGKDKVHFTTQLDCGDYVVAINAKEVRLAGNKMDTKLYHWHTRYPGGLRTRTARELLNRKPEKILFDSVFGMLPRNKLRSKIIKKFRVFPGETHEHTAQKLQPIEL